VTNWRDDWAIKVASADEAVEMLSPSGRILIGSGAAEPATLVQALVRAAARFDRAEVLHILTLGPAPYAAPGLQQHFHHVAFFIGANVREAVQAGRADFMPIFLSEIPKLIRNGPLPIDTALVQVSPPDSHGYVSLGVSVDVVRAAVDSARQVIAEVNPRMPRTLGDSFLHVSRIARLVSVDQPLPELPVERPSDAELEIGRNVASLVHDGATLQVGIGRIPNAVLAALTEKRDLGVHTEMLSDGVMELERRGVITGRRKTLRPGKMVTSFVMGSRQLYQWADNHPALELLPSDYVNDPFVIARNDEMVSINTALAVDLTGQVAADTVDGRLYSGIGGQVDFVRGAARARNGKSIIALSSTAKSGAVSRIQGRFDEGTAVVTSRGDVHHVVTEYGIAELWGKTVRERAKALIAIAHPSFRERLTQQARAAGYQ
jgi:acyl-CoA hydrolase